MINDERISVGAANPPPEQDTLSGDVCAQSENGKLQTAPPPQDGEEGESPGEADPADQSGEACPETPETQSLPGETTDVSSGGDIPKTINTEKPASRRQIGVVLRESWRRASGRLVTAWKRVRRRRFPLMQESVNIACAALYVLGFAVLLIGFGGWLDRNVVYGSEEPLRVEKVDYDARNAVLTSLEPHVNVTLHMGEQTRMVNTPLCSVGEVLASVGIYPDENDVVEPAPDTVVSDGQIIEVDKIDEVEITCEEVVAHEVVTNYLQTIPRNTRETKQEGSDGLLRKTLLQVYENGRLISEELTGEEMVTSPVTEIINIGSGGVFTAPDGTRYSYSYYIDVEATAYGGEQFSGLTYTGKQIELGDIAVDPDVIPLHSKCYLIGDPAYGQFYDMGIRYAEDTGKLIVDNIIDVYLGDDVEYCKLFGRRAMRLYILD